MEQIINWLLKAKILKFGDFILKSGRKSKYFLNFGDVYHGIDLDTVSNFYYNGIKSSGLIKQATVVFGPAYKGISLAVVTAMKSAQDAGQITLSFCYNRKEEKDHGDKGKLVGSPLEGKKVIIIDDVITSGGSIIESAEIIKKNGGEPIGVVVGVDRMEPFKEGEKELAKNYLERILDIPVEPILTIKEIAEYMIKNNEYVEECQQIIKKISN